MTATVEYMSLQDQRVKLVQGALKEHSTLGDESLVRARGAVLEALDYMPEKVR